MSIDPILKRSGITFSIVRSGVEIEYTVGLDNREKSTGKRYVGFMPDTDIQAGDVLINPANEKFYVTETKTAFF